MWGQEGLKVPSKQPKRAHLWLADGSCLRWRLRVWVDQAKRLKSLEQKSARLTRVVADLSLDNSILQEVAAGTCSARPDGGKWSTMP